MFAKRTIFILVLCLGAISAITQLAPDVELSAELGAARNGDISARFVRPVAAPDAQTSTPVPGARVSDRLPQIERRAKRTFEADSPVSHYAPRPYVAQYYREFEHTRRKHEAAKRHAPRHARPKERYRIKPVRPVQRSTMSARF